MSVLSHWINGDSFSQKAVIVLTELADRSSISDWPHTKPALEFGRWVGLRLHEDYTFPSGTDAPIIERALITLRDTRDQRQKELQDELIGWMTRANNLNVPADMAGESFHLLLG
jgi:hypothetical protein